MPFVLTSSNAARDEGTGRHGRENHRSPGDVRSSFDSLVEAVRRCDQWGLEAVAIAAAAASLAGNPGPSEVAQETVQLPGTFAILCVLSIRATAPKLT
jgi:hypothetical protein